MSRLAPPAPTLPPPSGHATPTPRYRATPLRIACIQFDPKLGRVEENARKVKDMTRLLQPGSVDLVVLPEMALTGYVFTSPTEILPYLENPLSGPTTTLASSLANRLQCHVIAGYPEMISSSAAQVGEGMSVLGLEEEKEKGKAKSEKDVGEGDEAKEEEREANGVDITRGLKEVEAEGAGVGYNSAVVVSPEGKVVGNYRKSFRFETDKTWAREGEGFKHFDLPAPLGRTAIGICMDMNPKDFIAPWDAFELANYCLTNNVDTLVVPMAWLDPPAEPPTDKSVDAGHELDPLAPSEHNLNYWAARLTPLHDPAPRYSASNELMGGGASSGKEVVFVACNRVGTEQGTSCVMTISSNPSNIELIECCNMSEERVMLATVA